MNTTLSLSPALTRRTLVRTTLERNIRLYALEAWSELIALVRQPGFTLPALTFPAFFYLVFGVLLGGGYSRGLRDLPTYLIVTYAAFGSINVGLHAFGMGVAMDRGLGWLTVKRASPMPAAAYFVAKLVACLAFGVATFLLLAVLGATLGRVCLEWTSWVLLGGALMAGSLPFAAMGVAIGYLANPRSVGGVVNLIGLPWALASGLWIPIEALPGWWQQAAAFLPPYHYAQLVLTTVGMARDDSWLPHVAVLAAFGLACLAVARAAYRRGEEGI